MSRDYGRITLPCPSFEEWGMTGRNARHRYNRKVATWEKTGGYCVYCDGRLRFGDFHMDHARSKWGGGSNAKENLVPSCLPCNNRKWCHDAIFWCTETGNHAAIGRLTSLGIC